MADPHFPVGLHVSSQTVPLALQVHLHPVISTNTVSDYSAGYGVEGPRDRSWLHLLPAGTKLSKPQPPHL